MNTTASTTPSAYVTDYASKAALFYDQLLASGLIASNWPLGTPVHNFGLEYGEGANFRKVFFHIEEAKIENYVHLALDCGIGDYILDHLTTTSVDADAFPSLRQTGSVLGWHPQHVENKTFPEKVTLRQYLLARQFDVPPAFNPSADFARLLLARGISIPLAVSEQELTRVNANRELETEPYILEESSSQTVGRHYGMKPKNAAGKPCEELTEAKKRKLYSTRFMHRFGWTNNAIYIPASPERVMAMLSVFEEEIADGGDVSWALHPKYPLHKLEGRITLVQILQSTVTNPTSSRRFPSQDLFCLKWRMLPGEQSQMFSESIVTLGDWLSGQGYLSPYWRGAKDGSLKFMRA